MYLFDENGKIKKYNSNNAILKHFINVRLELYQKRKYHLLNKWKEEMNILKWKLKFVKGVISEEIIVFKKKITEIIQQLKELQFPKLAINEKMASYDYLTSMTILKFSKDEIEKFVNLLMIKKKR